MKLGRSSTHSKAHRTPKVKFERQAMTSFSGLVLFAELFRAVRLKDTLQDAFRHVRGQAIYGHACVFMQLVVHLLLGFRGLREARFYEEDPLVKRVLGVRHIACAATLSRYLRSADEKSVRNLRQAVKDLALAALSKLASQRITLDFDGTVQSTRRKAEHTAVGYNKKRKGQRGYYPLFCTVAQTRQVFDFLHRPGNVHDSNGAGPFIRECLQAVDRRCGGPLEVRMDSAFFSDRIVQTLQQQGVEFTITVPFQRFPALKEMIEQRPESDWERLNIETWCFERSWKPHSWSSSFRFVFVRTSKKQIQKGPIQLHLFEPVHRRWEYKVIVTNKNVGGRHVVKYHDGRGSQEGILGEVKSACQGGHIPVRTKVGNQLYLLAGIFAHNMTHELQMRTAVQERSTTPQRAALWTFERLETLRKGILQRAGRLTSPGRTLTLTISAGKAVREQILGYLRALQATD